ncbi:polyprenyl synthetase family protein [Silanimonas sp.]|uniref:polyprenyl synthetase family protein n=1 Tax=Silanimonas sp. TaxID=1929290 RepID=UPI001BBA8D0C|nr:farnesyl diphosphate synthase [Silanimonas sp.]MBS3896903.1 polyprenyl synthetase family protein [Silanimonas sp.]
MAVEAKLEAWRARIDAFLDARLPPADEAPEALHAAMRYAVLGQGKRLRPLLVYAAAEAVAGPGPEPMAALDHAAAAIELVHAYSLVHDDLPAMDDDALRRGRPTVHIAFDEATAILAGDALQSAAFEVLAAAPAAPERVVAALRELARAAGASGMCGGQAIDMAMTGRMQSVDALAAMHRKKTGALIEAAVVMGGLLRGADEAQLVALRRIGTLLGLGFQIKDDLLDAEADSMTLGKTAGKDAAQGKSTYVTLLGLEGARGRLEAVASELDEALTLLAAQHQSGDAPATKDSGQALSDLAAMALRRSR